MSLRARASVWGRALLGVLALALGSAALAHATLVLGTLTVDPDPPAAGRPLAVSLEIADTAALPVEDASILVEFTPRVGGDTVAAEMAETEVAGRYRGSLLIDEEGVYDLLIRDRTFRQEEATASLELEVGGAAQGPLNFVFPPTATGVGERSLPLVLILMIGMPLLAAVVVTVLVLRGGPPGDEDGA